MQFFILTGFVLTSFFGFSQTLQGKVKSTANLLKYANDTGTVIIQLNPEDDFHITAVSNPNFVKVSYRKNASTYTGYINKIHVNADKAYENHLKVLKAKEDLENEKKRSADQKVVKKEWEGFVKEKNQKANPPKK